MVTPVAKKEDSSAECAVRKHLINVTNAPGQVNHFLFANYLQQTTAGMSIM